MACPSPGIATPARSRCRRPCTGARVCTAGNHGASLAAGPPGRVAFSWPAFVRWDDGRVYFDTGGTWEELRKRNEVELNFRNPLVSETRHPLYRAQSERWLQSI